MAGRILVIRGGAIGDFILTLPAIGLLREHFSEAEIEILGYQSIVALAEGRHYAVASRSIEYGPLAKFFVPGIELPPDLKSYFGGFNHVISYLFDPDGRFEANVRRCGVRSYLAATPKVDDSAHAARQLARPLESMALYLEDPAARLFPSTADALFAKKFLGDDPRAVIAVHPGSGSLQKNWPSDRWAELGWQLVRGAVPLRLLLVGGEADEESTGRLADSWLDLPVLQARNLPLPHLAAVLARCRLFLGHDSGISHLAAAAGAPCVLLFGPTDPDVWAPANPGVRVVRAPVGVLAGLGVSGVLPTVIAALRQTDIDTGGGSVI